MVNSIIGMEKNGKIYIPKEIRENYGTKFFIVPYRDKIIPYDIPENPIEDLIRLGERLRDIPIKKLKNDINEEAYNDIR
ncbi:MULTISPECIES: hypothetical protein [Acidiplasma]|jgi:bifunctional DNA-binding transcriptional regulator/antitoxin component of YhaV-PrlF toxin-antitoxin module|uniref:SpoVT-AbrB domain-containing protein n=1 Tax=Acidiplasma aeolicum TaxID=507754 RepID=A0A0N8VKX1_9ARCH|nr:MULTISPECIES: hypothetical protein [Acidiplasma]KJE49147.1 hypothetical protein TZ01_03380 [Acidiplasma sp. MBA-1]KQB34908.1 hypothetical protein AOG54_03440 [Acidiplasma aeolicum]WMT54918.1 MAG: hypothetical protein RE470_08385 [Acidiplasma sp.]